ncbi:MAG: Flp pilus assembly complex ATPase component TadA, partial [Planctomycetes bacterium]|nr:Flp pilus assembly complex ATPase component TadA [Planctomycetota bacterium]
MDWHVCDELLAKKLITEEQVKAVTLAGQVGDFRRGIDPGDPDYKIIILLGFASSGDVAMAVAKTMGVVAYLVIEGFPVDPHLPVSIQREFSEKHQVIPLLRSGRNMALVAASAPLAPEPARFLSDVVDVKELQYLPVRREDLPDLITKIYDTLKQREVHSVRLGEVLVREGLLPKEKLQTTIAAAQAARIPLGRYMVKADLVDEETLFRTLAGMANLQYVNPAEGMKLARESTLKQRLKKEYVKFNLILPYAIKNRVLYTLTANPFVRANELPQSYGCTKMEASVITESAFGVIYAKIYNEEIGLGDEQKLASAAKKEAEGGTDGGYADSMTLTVDNEADIRARYEHMVNRILLRAIQVKCSDIHIENYEGFIQTRLRIDGVLHAVPDSGIDKDTLRGVMNILKIEGNMNIAETRQPQGGSFRKITPDGQPFDFRVQIMPTVNGEAAVIRLLPGKKTIP